MATPSEMLWDLVDPDNPDQVISQSDLAKKLGVGFQTVYRWARGKGFTPARQQEVAAVLDLAPDHFSRHEDLLQRERYRERRFAEFLETELGRSATDEERRLLRAPRFDQNIVPTVTIYRSWLLALRGALTEEQIDRALEEKRRAEEVARSKAEAQRRARRDAKRKPRKK